MKKIITTLTVMTLLAACSEKTTQGEDNYAIISGRVSTPGEIEKVLLAQNNEVVKEIPVSPSGFFQDTIRPITENHYYYLFESSILQIPIYLDKQTNLELTFDKDLEKTVLSGTEKEKNQYLLDREVIVNNKIFRSDAELFKQEPKVFKENIKKYFEKLKTKLNSYKFDKEFLEKQQKWIEYKFAECLVDYPNSYNYFVGTQPVLPEDFYEEIKGIDFDNAQEYDSNEAYSDLVQRKYFQQIGDLDDPVQLDNFIKTIGALKSENIRSDFAEGLASMIHPSNPKNKEILDFVLANSKEEEVKQTAQLTYDKITKLAVGAPSPVFTNYENANGGTTSLSDLKGKLVYVDVWATWCRPCLAEIPALKALHDKLKGKNIEFVSISIDEDKDAWRKVVKERELKGVQLIADKAFESQFIRDYSINQIPTFLIIDKEGRIIDPDAPRPSDPQLVEVLEKLLK